LCKLSRVEMERLLQSCRLKSYDHGEVVFKKGDSPHFLAICLEGRLGNKIER
jgi:CRP-like cAMP-binding protein